MAVPAVDGLRGELDALLETYATELTGSAVFEDERVHISPSCQAPTYTAMRDSAKLAINVRADPDVGFIDAFNIDRGVSEASRDLIREHGPDSVLSYLLRGYMDRAWDFENVNLYLHRGQENCAGWHYDRAAGSIKAFIYLTDVIDEDDGPYCYALGTHREAGLRDFNKAVGDRTGCKYAFYEFFDRTRVVKAIAPRGTLILSDQSGAHRGWRQAPGRERYILVYLVTGR